MSCESSGACSVGVVCLDKKNSNVLWEKRIVPEHVEVNGLVFGKDGTIYCLVDGNLGDEQPSLIALK